LSDSEGKVLDLLNIRHGGGRAQDDGDIAFPSQILVDRDGIVRWMGSDPVSVASELNSTFCPLPKPATLAPE